MALLTVVCLYAGKTTEEYGVRIKPEGSSTYTDQIYVSASDDAVDAYVAGVDVLKMVMGTPTVASIWVSAYGNSLSVNQALLVEDTARYNLVLSVPSAGSYVLYLKKAITDGSTLSLYQNGAFLGMLSTAGITLSLPKGETRGYSLVLDASEVETVPTDTRNSSAALSTTKELRQGRIVITVAEREYDILGLPIH